MYNIYFFIILSIILFSYFLEQILDFLNARERNKNIPKELEDLYDKEKYLNSQNYGKVNYQFSILTSSISLILLLSMLFCGGFSIVNDYAFSISKNPIITSLIFFGIIMFVSDLLQVPFSYYSTFVIEERFGFNKSTIKTFVLDKLKGWLLMALIGGAILSLIIWIFILTNEMFWIYTWIFISIFSIFMALFYSNIIVPLFNKQKPLEQGTLRNTIEDFGKLTGFQLDSIYIIDESKRSTKANAYFTGFGPKKRIVLYDTLINDLTENEIVAVLAHEIGHYKKNHVIFGLINGIIQTGIMLFIFSLFINNLGITQALGASQFSFQLGLISFGLLYSPISMIIGLFMNIFSRKNEYEADNFATKQGFGKDLISGLKKLNKNNLSNLTPHKFYVFFHYSHPTLYQRIIAINKSIDTIKM